MCHVDDLDTLPVPSSEVVSRRLDDQIVLVHLQTNRIFSLNETGARLWELLSEEPSRVALETCFQSEYEATAGDVTEAVDDLLARLVRERLVQPRAS